MNTSREILVGMAALSAFVLIVSGASLYTEMQISSGNACGCFIPISLFIPFLASVGLFIGMLMYNIFFPEKEVKKIKPNKILRFFDNDEKKLMREVIKNREILQSDLVRNTELSKVKVHRILKKLKGKNIIEKEPHGKTNKISLTEDLKDYFS